MIFNCIARPVVRSFSVIRLYQRNYSTKKYKYLSEPINVSVDPSKLPPPTKIDTATIEHLERLSLVDFGDERGIKIVEDAIRFADQLSLVDTTNVEPMTSVLEDEPLYLREDEVVKEISREEILSHAEVTEEEYYTAPVGNIELNSDRSPENKSQKVKEIRKVKQSN